MLPTGLWLLGSLLHVSRAHDFSTYPQHNVRLNTHLRVDAWLQLLLGVAWLAFPAQLCSVLVSHLSFSLAFPAQLCSTLVSHLSFALAFPA